MLLNTHMLKCPLNQPVIYIRRTLDWENSKIEDLVPNPRFRKNLREWSGLFNMSYAHYRQELKDIAQATLQILNVPILSPKEIPVESLIQQDNKIIFPIDDDDWYSPKVIEHVMPVFHRHPQIDVITWPIGEAKAIKPPVSCVLDNPKRTLVRTNAYAIRSRVADKNMVLYHHAGLTRWANQPENKPRVQKVHQYLGIKVCHIGSLWTLGREDLQAALKRARPRKAETPKAARWAEDHLSRLNDLIQELFG